MLSLALALPAEPPLFAPDESPPAASVLGVGTPAVDVPPTLGVPRVGLELPEEPAPLLLPLEPPDEAPVVPALVPPLAPLSPLWLPVSLPLLPSVLPSVPPADAEGTLPELPPVAPLLEPCDPPAELD